MAAKGIRNVAQNTVSTEVPRILGKWNRIATFPPKWGFYQGPLHGQAGFLWRRCRVEQESQRTFETHPGLGPIHRGMSDFQPAIPLPCPSATHLITGSVSPFFEVAVTSPRPPGECPPQLSARWRAELPTARGLASPT